MKAALAGAASVARATGLHPAALAADALAIIVSRRAAIAFLGSPVGLCRGWTSGQVGC